MSFFPMSIQRCPAFDAKALSSSNAHSRPGRPKPLNVVSNFRGWLRAVS